MVQNNKENRGDAGRIARLEAEKRGYEEALRRRTEEVEGLKKEKARLEASVWAKLAIAAARKL